MSISLKKGEGVNLSHEQPQLKRAAVGLGWDERLLGEDFDLDASAFLLKNGRVRSEADFIFYNQLRSPCGAVVHQGDNRTGAGEGDDEVIHVDLTQIASDIDQIVFTVTIYEAEEREQNFGMVSNAFIRLVDLDKDREIVRYDLTEDFSTATAVIFAELKRNGDQWYFNAVGEGMEGGLAELAQRYGISV